MKPYYSEYVRHCLRFYVKTIDNGGISHFRSEIDKLNWSCCNAVVTQMTEADISTVLILYRPGDTMADKIYALAKERRVDQDTIWGLVNNLERAIAKRRGLL